jgi:hypothetical protein
MRAVSNLGVKVVVALTLAGLSMGAALASVDVAGVKYEDSMSVAGKDLVLNGAGVRSKFVVKVYTAGLYLSNKESTTEGVLASKGPRRMRLVMMRDVSSDDLGSAFMIGLNQNVSEADRSRIIAQISQYGELFAQYQTLKKGDTLDIDWIPGAGTQVYMNNKKIGAIQPDILFHNSILRIWLGDKAVDSALKPKLLDAPAKK